MRNALEADAANGEIWETESSGPRDFPALGKKLKFFPDGFQVFTNGVNVSGATNFTMVERGKKKKKKS